ncbi:MAG: hypothetical protein EBR50_07960, partial [Proteobacteria bacterium]|nr:hypothetical protein [Pseudomonadota bacterium]
SYELTQGMADLGLLGALIPEEYGGAALDYVSYIIAVEEIARIDGSQGATIAAHNSLGTGPLIQFGNEEQKKKYLPKLAEGHLWGFGLTEPEAGSDAGNTQTTAVKDGDEWVINGSKIFITNSATDKTIGSTVLAKTGTMENGRSELTCFIVENDAKGFTQNAMHGKMMWRASNTGELHFEDVRVKDSAILGKRGDGFKQMLATLDKGRLSIAAMGLVFVLGMIGRHLVARNQSMEVMLLGQEFQTSILMAALVFSLVETKEHAEHGIHLEMFLSLIFVLLYHSFYLVIIKKFRQYRVEGAILSIIMLMGFGQFVVLLSPLVEMHMVKSYLGDIVTVSKI